MILVVPRNKRRVFSLSSIRHPALSLSRISLGRDCESFRTRQFARPSLAHRVILDDSVTTLAERIGDFSTSSSAADTIRTIRRPPTVIMHRAGDPVSRCWCPDTFPRPRFLSDTHSTFAPTKRVKRVSYTGVIGGMRVTRTTRAASSATDRRHRPRRLRAARRTREVAGDVTRETLRSAGPVHLLSRARRGPRRAAHPRSRKASSARRGLSSSRGRGVHHGGRSRVPSRRLQTRQRLPSPRREASHHQPRHQEERDGVHETMPGPGLGYVYRSR